MHQRGTGAPYDPWSTNSVAALPETAVPFAAMEFPFPVSEVLRPASPDLGRLREKATELQAREAAPQEAAWVALMAAEAVESTAEDRERFFLSDATARGLVFTGIKWRAGWALLGENQEPYARFCGGALYRLHNPRRASTRPLLGSRDTASVYVAQLLARYALLYSDVQPGATHDLGHFVEDHGPGVLVVSGPMRPVEALLCLALMRLGMRAVVTGGFPWEMGIARRWTPPERRWPASASFENLRLRSPDPLSGLPEYANPAYAHEKLDPARRRGGGRSQLPSVRAGEAEEGVEASGEVTDEVGPHDDHRG